MPTSATKPVYEDSLRRVYNDGLPSRLDVQHAGQPEPGFGSRPVILLLPQPHGVELRPKLIAPAVAGIHRGRGKHSSAVDSATQSSQSLDRH